MYKYISPLVTFLYLFLVWSDRFEDCLFFLLLFSTGRTLFDVHASTLKFSVDGRLSRGKIASVIQHHAVPLGHRNVFHGFFPKSFGPNSCFALSLVLFADVGVKGGQGESIILFVMADDANLADRLICIVPHDQREPPSGV